jgi:hypothetical protein
MPGLPDGFSPPNGPGGLKSARRAKVERRSYWEPILAPGDSARLGSPECPAGAGMLDRLRFAREQCARDTLAFGSPVGSSRRAAPTGARGVRCSGARGPARLGAVLVFGPPPAARGMQLGAGVAQFRGRRAAGAAARSGVALDRAAGRSLSARDSGQAPWRRGPLAVSPWRTRLEAGSGVDAQRIGRSSAP